jgi:hypothetical protein
MRRVVQAMAIALCLAGAVQLPRGLAVAALAAGLGIARALYAQQQPMG